MERAPRNAPGKHHSSIMNGIKVGAVHVDSGNMLHWMSLMDSELKLMRRTYERDLAKLREQLIDASRSFGADDMMHSRLKSDIHGTKNEILKYLDHNSRLQDEIAKQKSSHHTKQHCVSDAPVTSSSPVTGEYDAATDAKLTQILTDNQSLIERIQEVQYERRQYEDTVGQLTDRLEFNKEVAARANHELKEKLSAASSRLIQLERRVRYMARPEHDQQVEEMVKTIKYSAAEELQKYKLSAEDIFNKNVTSIKVEMDVDRKVLQTVQQENQRLFMCIRELNTKIGNLKHQRSKVDQERKAAEESLLLQMKWSRDQHAMLDQRLEQRNSSITEKVKQLEEANNRNLPLKTEMALMKALIDSQTQDLVRQAHGCDTPSVYGVGAVSAVREPSNLESAVSEAWHCGKKSGDSSLHNAEEHVILSDRNQLSAAAANKKTHEKGSRTDCRIGQGRGYMEQLFHKPASNDSVKARSLQLSGGSTGQLHIYEISRDGAYITLNNASDTTDVEIGGYTLQQRRAGAVCCSFTFPRTVFEAGTFLTIFSGERLRDVSQIPGQFICEDGQRWSSDTDITTIFCKQNGQAVSWVCAQNIFDGSSIDDATSRNTPDIRTTPLKRLSASTPSPGGCSGHRAFAQRDTRNSRPQSAHSRVSQTGEHSSRTASALRMGSAPMRKYAI